jgi:hypothetical protein
LLLASNSSIGTRSFFSVKKEAFIVEGKIGSVVIVLLKDKVTGREPVKYSILSSVSSIRRGADKFVTLIGSINESVAESYLEFIILEPVIEEKSYNF